jgi:RNA polymerase sigma-70 factor (ECF subfamily)
MTAESRVRSSQEEALLIGQVLEGRQDLFCDLLRPHLPVLPRVVRAKMQNDPEAEDVVQPIVLKAFARLDRFRFEASFRTWLTRIAINEVLQWHRGPVASRFFALEQSALAELQIVDQAFSPLKEYERCETARLVRGALAKLPEDYRVMIRLRDLEGRSVAETARLLRLSVPAAKTRHYRARRNLGGGMSICMKEVRVFWLLTMIRRF